MFLLREFGLEPFPSVEFQDTAFDQSFDPQLQSGILYTIATLSTESEIPSGLTVPAKPTTATLLEVGCESTSSVPSISLIARRWIENLVNVETALACGEIAAASECLHGIQAELQRVIWQCEQHDSSVASQQPARLEPPSPAERDQQDQSARIWMQWFLQLQVHLLNRQAELARLQGEFLPAQQFQQRATRVSLRICESQADFAAHVRQGWTTLGQARMLLAAGDGRSAKTLLIGLTNQFRCDTGGPDDEAPCRLENSQRSLLLGLEAQLSLAELACVQQDPQTCLLILNTLAPQLHAGNNIFLLLRLLLLRSKIALTLGILTTGRSFLQRALALAKQLPQHPGLPILNQLAQLELQYQVQQNLPARLTHRSSAIWN